MRKHLNHSLTDPAEYETRRGGHLHDRRVRLISRCIAEGPGPVSSVVDLGCGTGAVLADVASRFPDVLFRGIDLEPQLIAYARQRHRRPNVTWVVGNAQDGLAGRFDAAFSVDVLHHVEDPVAFMDSVHASLGPGGRWIVIEPNIFHPYVTWQQASMRRAGLGEDHFRPWRMLPLARRAGFRVESRSYAHLFPGSVKSVSTRFASVELAFERLMFVGGSVVIILAVR